MSKRILLCLAVLCLTVQVFAVQAETPPQVQLANVYNQDIVSDISHYLVSEKYDGVRAIWTGENCSPGKATQYQRLNGLRLRFLRFGLMVSYGHGDRISIR